ncbi:MAG TPA: glycosyltransferase family 1 protein [Polyangia bacterium]|nr:glycosyltransferase family 1 protein [Polyangia bacterium]
MKIAFPLAGTDRGRSGLGVWARAVLPRLVRRARAENNGVVVLGTPADLAAYAEVAEGAERVVLPEWSSRAGLSAAVHLAAADRLARRRGADVLLLPAANRRFVWRSTLPTLAVIHDLAALHVPRKFGWLRDVWVRRALPAALRRCTRLVAISQATRDDLRGLVGGETEVTVVPNGVEAERFYRSTATAALGWRARAAFGLERPFLLYAARLEHPGKNHLRLVEAFAASGLGARADLVLAGADWGAQPAIEAAARAHGVEPRVRVLGFVERWQLEGLVAASSAVAMVGLLEGFGLPALEALAAGKPVVASSTGALPEVTGGLAALCDPYDVADLARGLRRMFEDDALVARAAAEGPRWAGAHTWDRTADALYGACRQMQEAA